MIYLLFFFALFMICTFLTHRRQALYVVSALVFLFLALTYPSGGDWIGYFLHYDCMVNEQCNNGFIMFEPGYELIVSLFGYLGFQTIIIFIAAVNVILILNFAKHFENGSFVIVAIMCMFLWSVSVEAIRQALALSIVIFGIHSLFLGRKRKFITLVLFASTFHITALICFLLMTPLFSKKLSKIISYSLLIFSSFFFAFSETILSALLAILPEGSIASEKLSFYLATEQYRPQLSIGSGTILDIILIFLICVSFKRIKKYMLANYNAANEILLIGCCLYISFGIFIGKMMPVMTRIGWYGFPFVIVLLYINLGYSEYFKRYINKRGCGYSKLLIAFYFLLQILRPLTYDYSYYNIMHQDTLLNRFDALDDASLRQSAKRKCFDLGKIGYGFLCSI
ncbi:O4 family O-antigen polymerase [Escherichia coli]